MGAITQTAFERVTRKLAEVTGIQPNDERGNWRCPSHDDRNPSLSVTQATDKVLLNCHRGCATEESSPLSA
jgi:hypothetical protein